MNPGEAELFKGSIHLGMFGLAVTCLAYNAMAYSLRKQQHLLTNAVVYAGLSWFEARQIQRHLEPLNHDGV